MSTPNHSALIKVALEAVLAGAKLAENAAAAQSVQQKESLRDIVTATDTRISELLMQRLGQTGLPVISEESDARAPGAERFWVVDPIDGTVNFAHGLAAFAVSAGLVESGQCQLGVVCAPKLDELYFTLNPDKALLNGRPFVHLHRGVEEALVSASFSGKAALAQYTLFQQINESTRGCLRTGSAALNVCWAAAGKLQAAYGFDAKLWDVAGALAVAKAAGCELRLRPHADPLRLDYIVGSREVVDHLAALAHDAQLWTR